jgi:glycosyltransferase involved in cell wall biosynthesis
MEAMVSRSSEYQELERHCLPILIYKTEPICYGILNHLADRMAEALEELGECVEIFDIAEHPLDDLREWSRKKYKAVLGFQSYLFSIKLDNGENLHDHFDAPMYNMILDHPAVMHKHLMNAPKNMTILTHDRNYQKYLRTYYDGLVKAKLLPPGGGGCAGTVQKKYDLTFVGSFRDWKDWLPELKVINRKTHGLARKLVHEMQHHPNDIYEACFERILDRENLDYSMEQKREALYECRASYCCVMNYYRQKIIKIILDAGIELHVYGDTWNKKEWEGYLNLVRHAAVEGDEALEVYSASRLSLNIMSWHKAGMTERIADMLLCGTVVVTDKSDYLEEHFTDGTDLVFFDLEHIERLPDQIRSLLSDEQKQRRIAEAGCKNAQENHTWNIRARQFTGLLS